MIAYFLHDPNALHILELPSNTRREGLMRRSARIAKHLELVQGTINRLGFSGLMCKCGSILLLAAAAHSAAVGQSEEPLLTLTILIPILGLWLVDSYFLWQERLFRSEYDRIRQQETTDYRMDPLQHRDRPKHSWRATFTSVTMTTFYGAEVLFIALLAARP